MSDRDEELDKLRKLAAYYAEWLGRHEAEADAAGEVKKRLDLTQWRITAIESLPPEADEIPRPDLSAAVDSDIADAERLLPLPFVYRRDAYVSASPFSTGTTAVWAQYVDRVGYLGTPAATAYASRTGAALQGLYERHDRIKDFELLLQLHGLTGRVKKRLKNAVKSYMSFRAGTGTASAAATDIRLLLDGVIGQVKAKAFKPRENKAWGVMAERLALGGPGSDHHRELLSLEGISSALAERLGGVIHDRMSGPLYDPETLWLEVLSLLIALLGHISPPD